MKHVIWLDRSAEDWLEAFPLGNGTLGAMVYGGRTAETILLNHEWLYRAKNRYRQQERKSQHLQKVRELFLTDTKQLFPGEREHVASSFANSVLGGEGGVLASLMGKKNRVDPFQPAGHLTISYEHINPDAGLRRELDLRDGISRVERRTTAGATLVQESFAHCSAKIIATQITSDSGGTIDCTVSLSRIQDAECTIEHRFRGDALGFTGRFVEGVLFSVDLRAIAPGGRISPAGDDAQDGLQISGAREILIICSIATSIDSTYPEEETRWTILDSPTDWRHLVETHRATHRAMYNRVSIDLGDGKDALPTDQRIENLKQGNGDASLFALYFQYGRYLLMASSRPHGLPANLQGVWNAELKPPWDSDFHNDVNLQMNYWAAESGNLSECADPLLDFIDRFVEHGRIVARDLYGCRGVYYPIQTDPWGRATPESRGWDVWTGAAAWLSQHMWWRFEYSGDVEFLKKRAYPFLKEVAAFYESYLIRDSKGRLVTVPSQSPENYFKGGTKPVSLCVGATMDFELIYDVFTHLIKGSEILGVDEEKRDTWCNILDRIPPLQIGKHGQLQEWLEDYEEGEVPHRHISHLVGAYPGDQITLEDTPELAEAVRITLRRRMDSGGQRGGWSAAMAACVLARLRDAEKAYERTRLLIANCAYVNLLNGNPGFASGGRKYFQIDGNFGGTAAVMEMLLQSRNGIIYLLPSLPDAWKTGHVHGVRAKGGFAVDIDWKDKLATQVVVRSSNGGACRIDMNGMASFTVICDGTDVAGISESSRVVVFETQPGAVYQLVPKQEES